jgi:hypothetical protein
MFRANKYCNAIMIPMIYQYGAFLLDLLQVHFVYSIV